MKYSNEMNDIYENIAEYSPYKELKILILVDDMIY